MTHYLGFWYFWGVFFEFLGLFFLGFLNFRNHFWNLLKKLGRVYFLFTHGPRKVEPWVNRWTFSSPPPSSPPSPSPPPPPSHHQMFVSLRYRKCQFSNWFDFPGNSSDSYLFMLLLFPGVWRNCPLLSGELSTDSKQSSDSYCSSVQSSPGLDI